MDFIALLQQYGYLAVLAGTFLEGETVLVMAGFAASRHHLDLSGVILTGAAGAFLGDQWFFALGGRYHRHPPSWLRGLPAKTEKINRLVQRYGLLIVIALRFMYGFRIAGPVIIGMLGFPRYRFAIANLAGAVLWSAVISSAGYAFGQGLRWTLADFYHDELIIFGLIALGGVAYWLIRRHL